jgi:hypothetical protein
VASETGESVITSGRWGSAKLEIKKNERENGINKEGKRRVE